MFAFYTSIVRHFYSYQLKTQDNKRKIESYRLSSSDFLIAIIRSKLNTLVFSNGNLFLFLAYRKTLSYDKRTFCMYIKMLLSCKTEYRKTSLDCGMQSSTEFVQ